MPCKQVKTEPGQVIKPDSCKAVDGEGMPLQGHPFEKGNLYIQFSVVFPDTLDPQQVRACSGVIAGCRKAQDALVQRRTT